MPLPPRAWQPGGDPFRVTAPSRRPARRRQRRPV